MGCGKTSIGWRLAKLMNSPFVDMDKYIEEKEHRTVSELFSERGEAAFRACEREAARELMQMDRVIVASGGGTVMDPENVKAFHEGGGVICFLDVPLAALQERLKRDRRRPLLQRPDRREFIERLYGERYPKYKDAADMVIDAGAPAVWVAKQMAKKFSE